MCPHPKSYANQYYQQDGQRGRGAFDRGKGRSKDKGRGNEAEEVEEKITEMVIEKPNQTREIRGILMISIVQVRITVIVVRNLLRKTPHYVIVSLVTCN